jgi:hypothetical protein
MVHHRRPDHFQHQQMLGNSVTRQCQSLQNLTSDEWRTANPANRFGPAQPTPAPVVEPLHHAPRALERLGHIGRGLPQRSQLVCRREQRPIKLVEDVVDIGSRSRDGDAARVHSHGHRLYM